MNKNDEMPGLPPPFGFRLCGEPLPVNIYASNAMVSGCQKEPGHEGDHEFCFRIFWVTPIK